MGDSDDLFFRFHDVIADEGDQLVQGGFATTAFFILDDVAVFVSAQDRFDAQYITDDRSSPAQASGSCQVFEITDSEDTVHFCRAGFQDVSHFIKSHAFFTHLTGIDREDSLCQGSVEESIIRIFLV